MTSSQPLTGTSLVDCAKANAKQGVETAAQLCGYGDDISRFQANLHQACEEIGIEVDELSDLITKQSQVIEKGGVEVAPDTPNSL
jgi:hypothetical protein